MIRPPAIVIAGPGTNRDRDLEFALTLAGAAPKVVLATDLVHRPGLLRDARLVGVAGGFSYGDALGAGTRWALEVAEPLRAFATQGRPVLGICNGFQVLVRAGLFGPGVTLTHNASGRFECRWVTLRIEADNPAGLAPGLIACPVAHGEGRLAGALGDDARPLFRYLDASGSPAGGAYPANPNGSIDDLAGLCNAAGNVWGLMPHAEDHIHPRQDPFHTPGRLGLALFEALVARARTN